MQRPETDYVRDTTHYKDPDAKRMMEFGDWLERRSMSKDWIVVAQYDVTECDGWKMDLFMTSVLAAPKSHGVRLDNSQWLRSNDFGKTEVEEDAGRVWFKEQTEAPVGKNADAGIEPFTFLRLWNDTWPDRLELVQSFILFYNLYPDSMSGKYMAVDKAGETTDVIRIGSEAQHQKIEIRARFLRNYLTCKNRVLVRQHDNRIRNDQTLLDLGIEPFRGRRLDSSDYVFDLTVVDGGLGGKGPATGLLIGKDLILPSGKRQHLLGWPEGHCKFIIGVDEHGEDIMSLHGNEDGPGHFLIPAYFKRGVLKRYRDSVKYGVNQSMISCGAHWNIPIQENGDLVRVFLGDLARLPSNEQRHWQSHNVRPEVNNAERWR